MDLLTPDRTESLGRNTGRWDAAAWGGLTVTVTSAPDSPL